MSDADAPVTSRAFLHSIATSLAKPTSLSGLWARAVGLLLLILWTPFITFLIDHSYPFHSPEVLLSLAGFAAIAALGSLLRFAPWDSAYALVVAGLVTWYVDFQFERMIEANKYLVASIFLLVFVAALKLKEGFYLVLTAFFTMFVAATGVIFVGQSISAFVPADTTNATDEASPSRLIHIILDGHIGVEGIPTNWDLGKKVKADMMQFYQRHGFTLYGGAHSHYSTTNDAIPNLFNFSRDSKNGSLVAGGPYRYTLLNNRYFEALAARHYRLNVIQSDYLDFCTHEDLPLRCQEHKFSAAGSLRNLDYPLPDKIRILLASYLTKYNRLQRVISYYDAFFQPQLASIGVMLPTLPRDSLWTSQHELFIRNYSANALLVLDTLRSEVRRLRPGQAIVAHLLFPHAPYIFKPDCTPRPIQEWKNRMLDVPASDRTPELRASRYHLYLEQVQCLYRKLDDIFDRMRPAKIFDDSIIILHGDHGSRLGLRDPDAQARTLLNPTDLGDAFSTLFAVKLPGKPAGYNRAVRPIETLLAEALDVPPEFLPPNFSGQAEPFIYLFAGDGKDQVRVPYPLAEES